MLLAYFQLLVYANYASVSLVRLLVNVCVLWYWLGKLQLDKLMVAIQVCECVFVCGR